MSGDKIYLEGLTRAQLAEFFRALADRLSAADAEAAVAAAETPSAPDPGDFKKLEISVRQKFDGFSLKWKSKEGEGRAPGRKAGDDTPEEEGEVRYKSLKKRMKGDFKAITESLAADLLPDEKAVAAFLEDSRLMTTFPDKGAECYGEYEQACLEFSRAFGAGDLPACKAAGAVLARLKKDCHGRHK